MRALNKKGRCQRSNHQFESTHLLLSITNFTMAGGDADVVVRGTADIERVEAPVTVRAYLICAFAAFGGIFYGYDTGWMSGVLGMP